MLFRSSTPLLSPIRSTCPVYLILLDFITRTILGEQYRSLSSSLPSFLHSLVTCSLLGPNILLNTLFSNTLSLRSSLNVSDQVSHPYLTVTKLYVQFPLQSKCSCGTAGSLLQLSVRICQSSDVTVCGVQQHFRSLDSFFKQGLCPHPAWSCIKTTFSGLSKGRVC